MVAADQRDSLRTMMAERTGVPGEDIPHDHLTEFKMAVARELGPYASALLIDRDYGYRQLIDDHVLPGTCAPILAVDVLDQEPGQAVEGTSSTRPWTPPRSSPTAPVASSSSSSGAATTSGSSASNWPPVSSTSAARPDSPPSSNPWPAPPRASRTPSS